MTSRRDTKGHCPWTVTSTAKPRTTLQRCLLSAVPPLLPCVYVHVRVFACVLSVCMCVCVCFLRLLECDSRHDKTVTVCAECYPRHDTGSHGPRTVTPNAEPRTTLQHFLLSSCPPPPHFLLMPLHVTYASPPYVHLPCLLSSCALFIWSSPLRCIVAPENLILLLQ